MCRVPGSKPRHDRFDTRSSTAEPAPDTLWRTGAPLNLCAGIDFAVSRLTTPRVSVHNPFAPGLCIPGSVSVVAVRPRAWAPGATATATAPTGPGTPGPHTRLNALGMDTTAAVVSTPLQANPSETRYSIALYENITSVVPYMAHDLTWAQLVECLGLHKPALDKSRVAMFGPHTIRDGQAVSLAAVTSVTFGVLDLDDGWTEARLLSLLSSLYRQVPFAFASSWSHGGPDKLKGRVIVPFSRPVLPSEWPRLWPVFNERFAQGAADPKCKDSSHRYFAPSYQEGGAVPPQYVRCDEGHPIDVDRLLLDAAPVGYTGSTTPTRDDFKRLSDRWATTKGSKKAMFEKLSKSLRAVVKGEPFAERGDRDNVLFQLCSEIVSRWPTLDADEAAKLFAPSCAIMGGDAPTPEKAADMMRRRQRGLVNSRAELVSEAFRMSGIENRFEPYTPQELEEYAETLGVPLDRLRRRWIIQKGNSFYVFVCGTYRRYSETDVVPAAMRDLAPAITAQVDTNIVTEKGVRPRTALELVKDYGAVATTIDVDLSAQGPHFDETRGVMVEAPCPIRVEPERQPAIERWLELLAGPEKHERLLQWLAATVMLNMPSAALYLEGPGGTGKSLLACGIARIWSPDRPTSLDEVMGEYNESFMRCPLVFGDEVAPVDQRGRLRTDYLREFIQARTRPLKRKYQPNATLRGCARLILAANNRNLLQTAEHLTENDINAIVERFFYLPVWVPEGCDPKRPPSRVYLESLGETVVRTWVDEDLIAKHVLWLAHNIVVPQHSRFLVSGEASDLTRSLATSTGLRASVCHWLVGYLLEPRKFAMKSQIKHLVRVSRGRLCVNARAVTECWQDYVVNDKDQPSPTKVSQALAGLSSSRTALWHNGTKIAYRVIDLENLREWADSTGYAEPDTLARAVAQLEDATAQEA